jgi:amino acid transporter
MVDLTNIGTLFAFILVCAGIIVLRIKDPARPRPFRVPGGLIIPILGIFSCLYLIYYLPPTSWLRFAAWLNFGFVIYVGYGAVRSRLTGRQHAESPAAHDAHTALTGVWLAIIGIALLVFMRGFDVWLEAQKAGAEAGVRAASALGEVFKLRPWMEVSWFLIVPLALNAFVLCPIVIKRAMRARREGAAVTSSSVAIASALMVMTLIYLLLLAKHNL